MTELKLRTILEINDTLDRELDGATKQALQRCSVDALKQLHAAILRALQRAREEVANAQQEKRPVADELSALTMEEWRFLLHRKAVHCIKSIRERLDNTLYDAKKMYDRAMAFANANPSLLKSYLDGVTYGYKPQTYDEAVQLMKDGYVLRLVNGGSSRLYRRTVMGVEQSRIDDGGWCLGDSHYRGMHGISVDGGGFQPVYEVSHLPGEAC